MSRSRLSVSLKCPADGQKWPAVTPQCLRCGASGPSARYRGRGLCAPCHKAIVGTDELRRYKKIPKDLRNTTLRKLYANPRRWLQQALGDGHARLFEDHEILVEALRVFKAFVLRWYRRTCYIYSPKVSVFEVVSAQASSYEVLSEEGVSEVAAAQSEPAPIVDEVKPPHLQVLSEVDAVAGSLGGGRLVWDLRRWLVIWGSRYTFLRVYVPHSGEPTYEYQNDLRRASGPYSLDTVAALLRGTL